MKEPRERLRKAQHLRTLARGYRSLKKERATAYEAAAQALELAEKRAAANRDKKV